MSIEQLVKQAIEEGAQQKESELLWLAEQLHIHQTFKMVEIGSYKGGTLRLWHWLLMHKIIAVDKIHESSIAGIDYIHGDSKGSYDAAKRLLGGNASKIDFLFIDGDHSYDGVKSDFETYYPMVKRGGIIAFHDIVESDFHKQMNCEVYKFWQELKTQPYQIREFMEGNDWGGIGILIK